MPGKAKQSRGPPKGASRMDFQLPTPPATNTLQANRQYRKKVMPAAEVKQEMEHVAKEIRKEERRSLKKPKSTPHREMNIQHTKREEKPL